MGFIKPLRIELVMDELVRRALPAAVPPGFAEPYFVLAMKDGGPYPTRAAVLRLIKGLRRDIDIDMRPIAGHALVRRRRACLSSISLACPSATSGGHDLRDILRRPGYDERLADFGVTDIFYRNFPEPAAPRSRHGIRHHCHGAPSCP